MAFEVTILGNSSATPTIDRHPSAQVLNIRDQLILIDCGEGTQNQMLRFKVRYNRIRYVFISHLHGDHYYGLPGLIATMSVNGRTEPLCVSGPAPLKEILEMQFFHSHTTLGFELIFIAVDPDKKTEIFSNPYFSVQAFPLKHRIGCTGFVFRESNPKRKLNAEACELHQIPFVYYNALKAGNDFEKPDGTIVPNEELTFPPQDPRVYAYCSDTVFDESIVENFMAADLLYHESTFLHEKLARAQETLHSTAMQAALIAKKAGVSKLLIGHFSARYDDLQPLLDEAVAVFPNTELAVEGAQFVVH